MNKCNKCDLKKLKLILFHNFEFQKCYNCNYIRIFKKDFEIFINAIMFNNNIGNIKRYDSDFNCNEFELKMLKDFKNTFSNFETHEITTNICDYCLEKLYKISFYKKFNCYFCKDCESIYFLQNEFDNFIKFLIKDLTKHNYLLHLKVILKNIIRKNKIKIKEIFLQRRKKNNVKK